MIQILKKCWEFIRLRIYRSSIIEKHIDKITNKNYKILN